MGVIDGTQHRAPQDYGFDYKTDSGIHTITQITSIYTHTHGFNSAPIAYVIFAGIEPYMNNLLNSSQKSKYLEYHSINVLTTNASYSITITDPGMFACAAQWFWFGVNWFEFATDWFKFVLR